MRTYFRSQLDLAIVLKDVIDKYWDMEISEDGFIAYIIQVENNNKEKLYKDGNYTTIIKQKLGIKRLELLDKVLKLN